MAEWSVTIMACFSGNVSRRTLITRNHKVPKQLLCEAFKHFHARTQQPTSKHLLKHRAKLKFDDHFVGSSVYIVARVHRLQIPSFKIKRRVDCLPGYLHYDISQASFIFMYIFTLFFYSWSIISLIFAIEGNPKCHQREVLSYLTVFQGQFSPQDISKQPHTHTQKNTYIFSNTLVFFKYLHSLWQSMIYTQPAHTHFHYFCSSGKSMTIPQCQQWTSGNNSTHSYINIE